MTAKHPAAFINAVAEEGTKDEAIYWLQRTWDDYKDLQQECMDLRHDLAKAMANHNADLNSGARPEATTPSWEGRCAALYQVIGALAHYAGIFEVSDDVADALDVAAGRGDVEKLLPWPKDMELFALLETHNAGVFKESQPQLQRSPKEKP